MTIKIISSGGCLPSKLVTNKDFEKTLDTSNEWIVEMTGIKERYFLAENDSFIDYTYQAALMAIQKADLPANSIDLIIVATTTPHQLMPSTAVILQKMLGINACISFDMQAACSGFVYALTTAYNFMQTQSNVKHALIVGCDAFSKVIDQTDRSTAILFGDGFGAVICGYSNEQNEKGIFYCDLGADGFGKESLEIPWGIGQGLELLSKVKPQVVMNGKDVFKNAVERIVNEINEALFINGLHIDEIDWIIPHQANIRILRAIASAMNIEITKFQLSVHHHGNTASASIPLLFHHLIQEGKIKRGDLVMFIGFGAGYTWGTILFEY